ncbi:uncharacterized protein LOC101859493 [Aplysia californica]|uniref:Uncharacterized protein LOC101859493 n=1 Tax=Aplysia californica TaxID=6500 RepID=A0ABM0JTE9_APLCA|nr:uncharacterized protein LOC101859493 [Aplysia californica]
MGLGETSLKWRLAIMLQFLGFLLGIAAVSSTYISAAEVIPNREHHVGFWDICFDTQTYGCQDYPEYLSSIGEDADWVYACRGLVVVSLIAGVFGMLVSIYLAYMASGIHMASLVTAVLNFLAVVSGLIGSIVFLVNSLQILKDQLQMDVYPSWSFAVIIIGLSFYFLAAITHIFELCTAN